MEISALDVHMEVGTISVNVTAALSDEVLQQLCMCLPGRELLRFAGAAKPLHELTSSSAGIWRRLAHALLGESLCQLHTTLAARSGEVTDTGFWRRLFRHGQEFRVARWSADLRSAFLGSHASDQGEAIVEERIRNAIVGSGHCSVGIGRRVVKVGGLRPRCQLEYLQVAIFDLETLRVHELELTADSKRPERRLRHAACEVRPALTGGEAAVLVLGGCHDRTKRPCQGGLRLLHILELLDETQALGRWHSVDATGEAPGSIWHHICGSFASGSKVVVSGGDFARDDHEFANISDRSVPACFVYVLDINRLLWERVATTGPAPTWRSLHAGFTHLDISSHSERLVILGGCAAHIPIFSSSDELAPMNGHALDLCRFRWLPQPSNNRSLPPARLRLASEKIGEWLLLYGGHGDGDAIGERAQLHKLNLRTLVWGTLDVRGREGSHPAAPAASMSAGLVLGGVKFTIFGITPVPKLDVLTLCSTRDQMGTDEEEDEAVPDSESDDDDVSNGAVAVVMRDAQGNARRLVLPRAMVELFLARQSAGQGADDDNEAVLDSESDDDDVSNGAVAVVMTNAQGNARRLVLPRAMVELFWARQSAGQGADDDNDDDD